MGFNKSEWLKVKKNFVGVSRTDSGKYAARIKDRSKKRGDIWLGAFNTPEEASQAYLSKKHEMEEKSKAKQGFIDWVLCEKSSVKKSSSHVLQNEASKQQISGENKLAENHKVKDFGESEWLKVKKNFVNVDRRRSGKYSARINDPFKKKRLWLGSFNTPEEALEAYFSKKREIEEKMKAKKKFVHCEQSSESSCSSNELMKDHIFGENNETENHKVINPGKYEVFGENKVLENDEDGFECLKGLQVIDKYGRFVGVFSMLDESMMNIC